MQMPRPGLLVALALALAALALPAAASANQFLYAASSGTGAKVNGYSIAADGTLVAVPGIPDVGVFPTAITASPNGKFVFVGASDLFGFKVGTDGSLSATSGSPTSTDANFHVPAFSPDGTHLYVAGGFDNNVHGYSVGASNGKLTELAGSPFPAGDFTFGVAITPDDKHLYASNSNGDSISIFDIAADGTLTSTGPPVAGGDGPFGMEITPDGAHMYVADFGGGKVSSFSIDAITGALTPIGSAITTGASAHSVAISPAGNRVYVSNQGTSKVSAFNIGAGGALSAIIGSPFTAGPGTRGIDFTAGGGNLYTGSISSNNVSAFNVSFTGSLSAVTGSPFAATSDTGVIAITPDQAPNAAFRSKSTGTSVGFDGSPSVDPDGTVARYDWDFGDGNLLPNGGPTPTHVYATNGDFPVSLTVTDDLGCSTTQVYTGQTAYCNGSAVATTSHPVTATDQVLSPKLKAKKSQRQRGGKIVILAKAGAATAVKLKASGKIKAAGKTFALKKLSKKAGAGKLAKLKLKLKKSADAKQVTAALGGEVSASIKVKFTDQAGNRATKSAKVKLK